MAAAPGPCPARSRRTGIVSTISATVTVCRSQLMTTPGRGRGLLRGPRPCNWKGCLLPAPFTRLPAKDRETVTPNSFSESYTSVITLPGVILARFRSLWCRRDSVCLPITIGQLIMRDGPAMRSPGASGARGSDPPGHEEETPPASRAGADHGVYRFRSCEPRTWVRLLSESRPRCGLMRPSGRRLAPCSASRGSCSSCSDREVFKTVPPNRSSLRRPLLVQTDLAGMVKAQE